MPERISFPRDLFRGTASFYARYRPPYPQPLIEGLSERVRISGGGRMVDLACSTGLVTLPLASGFAEVLAVDQEMEMIEMGRRLAVERGLRNVRWEALPAEELTMTRQSCELVTIGSAFHRLDRPAVTRRIFDWLRPGGTLAILDALSLWQVDEPWVRAVATAIKPFQPADRQAEAAAVTDRELTQRDILARAGFQELEDREYSAVQTWTAGAIVGYLYSTSQCSYDGVGERRQPFEAAVRRALPEPDHGGRYAFDLGFHRLTGKRPADGS